MAAILPYIQIAISVLLVGAILLQQRGSSLGGAFGADNFTSAFNKRRGLEKLLFQGTILLAVLFVATTFIALFLEN